MGLVRFGPVTLDVDDIRAIVEVGSDPPDVEVTFRDGSRMEFAGAAAEALRRFTMNLPDGIPVTGANLAVQGVVGHREDIPVVQRHEG